MKTAMSLGWKMSLIGTSLVLLAACSKDPKPTDDGEMQSSQGPAHAESCDAEKFAACAQQVLASSGLADVEVRALSSCEFEKAQALFSSDDVFEVARQAVGSTCSK